MASFPVAPITQCSPERPYQWDCLEKLIQEKYICFPVELVPFFFVVQPLSHVQPLQPHGLQHARLLCPSPSSRACLNSCSLSHEPLDGSLMPSNHLIFSHSLLLLPSIFPSISQSFPMSQLLSSGGQSTGASV